MTSQFDDISTTDPIIQPWTSNFSDSMSIPVLKTMKNIYDCATKLRNNYLIRILLINSIEWFQQTFPDVWTDTARR